MRNIRLDIEYEGTGYHGFQIQANASTVQEELESALLTITGEEIRVICAGRTDSGVHAKKQVINFTTHSTSIPTPKFVPALNTNLPPDIRIKKAIDVEHSFHAQLSAEGKVYQYSILCDPVGSAFLRRYSYHLRSPLAVGKMKKAAHLLVGRRDFSSFRASGCQSPSPVKELWAVECFRRGQLIHIRYKGSGFLYKMVRIISGTLVEVGKGKRPWRDVDRVLQARNRREAGPTLPAHGLCLLDVSYGVRKVDDGEGNQKEELR